jgi:hypothetical protein
MADGDPELDDDLDLEPDPVEPDEQVDDAEEGDEPDDTAEQPDLAARQLEGKDPERQPERQERQPSRSETRIRSLSDQVRERDRQLADTNRRIDELIRQRQPEQRGETPEQRAARFAIMTPQEQIAETLRESEQRHAVQLQNVQQQMLDTADRTAFSSKAAVDPLYARWAPKVEGKLAELRAKGNNVEREVLLKFLIGEAALERRTGKEGKREVRLAAQRVNRQRTRPGNSGSDTQAERRERSTAERRLENVQI